MNNVKTFEKLVRDRIPEIIESKGEKVVTRILDDPEYRLRLLEKLIEEAKELFNDPSKEEVADVLEVLESICEIFGYKPEEIQKVKKEKQQKRGGFKNKIFLEKTYQE